MFLVFKVSISVFRDKYCWVQCFDVFQEDVIEGVQDLSMLFLVGPNFLFQTNFECTFSYFVFCFRDGVRDVI